MERIVLASASPRRKELLTKYGYTPVIIESGFDEGKVKTEIPSAKVKTLSRGKAEYVASGCSEGDIIVAADTVVTIGGRIFGKPHSEEEAFAMLSELSGSMHRVYTGVTVIKKKKGGDIRLTFYDKADVYVKKLKDKEIMDYIETGEPMDKAGAYAIQGIFGKNIYRINGDVNTIIGLPVCRTIETIEKLREEGI